jgi:deazaflavin-dependent oxidoreductase (nitroreductase family)
MPFQPALAAESYAYLTTTGRRTGQPREIEIWFALTDDGATVWLLSGGGDRSNWVKNLRAEPEVRLRIGDVELPGRAELLEARSEEDARARDALFAKYRPGSSGDLEGWRVRALPVAIRV